MILYFSFFSLAKLTIEKYDTCNYKNKIKMTIFLINVVQIMGLILGYIFLPPFVRLSGNVKNIVLLYYALMVLCEAFFFCHKEVHLINSKVTFLEKPTLKAGFANCGNLCIAISRKSRKVGKTLRSC